MAVQCRAFQSSAGEEVGCVCVCVCVFVCVYVHVTSDHNGGNEKEEKISDVKRNKRVEKING